MEQMERIPFTFGIVTSVKLKFWKLQIFKKNNRFTLNTAVTEPKFSTPAVQEPATKRDSEPVPSTSNNHNLSPWDLY
jgi:hypothetical protein